MKNSVSTILLSRSLTCEPCAGQQASVRPFGCVEAGAAHFCPTPKPLSMASCGCSCPHCNVRGTSTRATRPPAEQGGRKSIGNPLAPDRLCREEIKAVAPIHAAGASDLVLRNVNTGAFEVYDIRQQSNDWCRRAPVVAGMPPAILKTPRRRAPAR